MIKLLIKKFIPQFEDVENNQVREKYSVICGILGIICNIILFITKAIIGILMNSIAIISDAFNNLSDSGTSIVTIVSAKLSNQSPDKEHPFGHGRIEYISSLILSFFIMIVGFELFKTSLTKIFNPTPVEFNIYLIIILIISILVKVWMFSYNLYVSKKINSSVLHAVAFDSLNDVIATSTVSASTVLSIFIPSVPVDAIAGLAVSGFIIWTGFNVAKDTITLILGTSPSDETVSKINELIKTGEGIVGTHDLIIHDYGPGRRMASVHAEVPCDIDIVKIHEIIDEMEKKVERDLGIHIVIHMDPIETNCEKTKKAKKDIISAVKKVNKNYNIHDFRMTDGEKNINVIFDLEIPCDVPQNERNESVEKIKQEISKKDEKYSPVINVDTVY